MFETKITPIDEAESALSVLIQQREPLEKYLESLIQRSDALEAEIKRVQALLSKITNLSPNLGS